MPTQGYITEIGAEWEGTTPSSQLQLPIAAAKLRDKANIDGIGFDGSAGIIHYATCTQAANVAAKSASVVDANGNALPFNLVRGSVVYVKFSNSNTAQNPTLNVNNTGAKSIKRYSTTAPSNTASTSWNAGSVVCLVYDGTYWQMSNWLNSTYANYSLGQGYGTCATQESTTAKIVTLSNYSLSTGGIVAVKFTNAVPANSTMDINSRGSKSIYHRGAPITSGIINAGDTATFIYSTYYHLISLDHVGEYELPIASQTVLGGVKVGAGLSISSGGVLSANGGGVADAVAWGNITGTLADQTDLDTAIGLKANTADLSAVAFSNDYDDLDNKPDIPTSTSELDNDSGFLTSSDLPQPADSNPLMDGTVSIGTSTDYAREDHRHPTDTSRAADTAVVHKAGAEVITGEKTTTADLILRNTTGSTGLGAATPNLVFQRGANTDSYIDWLVCANENGRLVVSSRSAGTDTVRMQLIGSSSLQQLLSSIDIKAPKFITDGGTAQQYVKGDGTLGGNATQSVAGLLSAADKTKLDGIAAGAEVNVQSDWNQTDNSADDFIKNKPNITTYDVFTYGSDATPDVPGTNGIVPAPTFGERTNVLRGDGSWVSLPSASSSSPLMDGTAAVGTSTSYSRGDHVHPTDTSRAADNAVVHRSGAETVSGAKTFTSNLTISGNATLNFETSQDAGIYVEASEDTNNVKELNFCDIEDDSQVRLKNVATPVQSTDAANKDYVDNAYDVFTYGSDTTPPVTGKDGLVPSPLFAERTKFLRGDGTWQTPQDTTYNNFTGATSSSAGSSGLVPAPSSGEQSKFLCANGNWETPTDLEGETVEFNGYSGGYGIQPWSLCAFSLSATGTTMAMTSFTNTAGMGGGAPITGYQFPIGCKIYYHPDSQFFAATTNFVSKKFYTTYKNVDARYSSVTGMPSGYTLGSSSSSAVYLRVVVSNGYWSPYYKSGETYENIVTSNNLVAGNFYTYLGKTVGSTGYKFQLEDNNPLYFYDGNSLIDWASYISGVVASVPWNSTSRLETNRTLGSNPYAVISSFSEEGTIPPKGTYVVCANALIKNPNNKAQQAHVLLRYRLGANAEYNTISAASVTLPPARTSSSGGTYGSTSVFLQGLVTLNTPPSFFGYGIVVEVEQDGDSSILVAESPLSGSYEGELDEGTTYIMMYKLR